MEQEYQENDLPVDDQEIQARMLEPEQRVMDGEKIINRNLRLGNLFYRDIRWMQALEAQAQNLTRVPKSQGGNIFSVWGNKLREEKNHFLALSGSRGGFVMRALKTTIQEQSLRSETTSNGGMGKFLGKKNREY